MTMTQFIANLVRVPLMEDPGTRYRYSESTTVLGRLVEIWSGKPFEVFLEERIFRPLRMTDTMFWAATPEQRARLTTVYAPAPGGGLTQVDVETLPFTERPTLIEGAVGLLSTVPDYLRFGQMLLNKGELDGVRLLSANTVETMTTNGLSDAVQKARGGSMGWGLANVNVLLNPAPTDPSSRGEYGWDGTAGTIFWVDPVKETVIGADDPELAVEPRSDPAALQGHRAAGARRVIGSVPAFISDRGQKRSRRGGIFRRLLRLCVIEPLIGLMDKPWKVTTSHEDRFCRPSPQQSAPPPCQLAGRRSLQATHEALAATHLAGEAKISFLSAADAADVEAVAAQIIPTDDTPGAREAGVMPLHRPGTGDVSLAARRRLSRAARRVSGGVSRAASRRRLVRVAHTRRSRFEYLKTVDHTPFFDTTRLLTLLGMFSLPVVRRESRRRRLEADWLRRPACLSAAVRLLRPRLSRLCRRSRQRRT